MRLPHSLLGIWTDKEGRGKFQCSLNRVSSSFQICFIRLASPLSMSYFKISMNCSSVLKTYYKGNTFYFALKVFSSSGKSEWTQDGFRRLWQSYCVSSGPPHSTGESVQATHLNRFQYHSDCKCTPEQYFYLTVSARNTALSSPTCWVGLHLKKW